MWLTNDQMLYLSLLWQEWSVVVIVCLLIFLLLVAWWLLRRKEATGVSSASQGSDNTVDTSEARRRSRESRERRGGMTRRQRERHLNTMVSDCIVDVLEDLEYQGKISRPELQNYYRRLSVVLKLPDLAPPEPEKVKETIKKRMVVVAPEVTEPQTREGLFKRLLFSN